MRITMIVLLLVVALDSLSWTKAKNIKRLDVRCQLGHSCPKPKTQWHRNGYPRSCLDYLRIGVSKCGVYKIYDNADNSFPVYCDMKSEPGNAWTLIMSWSLTNRQLRQYKRTALKTNAPINENAPNFNLYRQTLSRMQSIKSRSTHWRATCSYPEHGVDYRDYVRANFKDFDVINFIGSAVCKKVEYINIRGLIGIHTTAKWWQTVNGYALHIDSSSRGCGFVPITGSISSEDNFGYYDTFNPQFRCTANDKSTTQLWFGGHL